MQGNIIKNKKPLENAEIKITESNKKIVNYRSDASGKFKFKLEYNKYFKVEITKQGLVTKRFEFDTYIPQEKQNKIKTPFIFSIVLFPKYDYMDLSILDKPLAIIKYQDKYNDFFYDYDYAKSINDKVKFIENKIDELTNEYDKSIEKGNGLFELQFYRESLPEFEKAHDIYPDEKFPIEKIALINKILNNEENIKESYALLLSDAEDKIKIYEYQKAINKLEQANLLLPSEKYPLKRISEIKALMAKLSQNALKYKTAIGKGDNSLKGKMYTEAEIFYNEAITIYPDSAYPRERIAELHRLEKESDKETLFNIAIKEGDQLINKTKYHEAITAFKKALSYKSEEPYPKERIAYINKILETGNLTQELEAYNKLISEADSAMALKNYEIAKVAYLKASELKPQEHYPKDRIQDIDNITENMKQQEGLYEIIITDADKKLSKMKFDAAIEQYKYAHTINPDDKYPEIQITKVNYLKEEEAKLDAQYQKVIDLADKLYEDKEYSKARITYLDALDLKPDEKYPQEKINDIDKILLTEIDKGQAYRKIIKAAYESMDLHEYGKAKDLFVQATKLMPDDKYSRDKADELNKILVASEISPDAYPKIIVAANVLETSLKDYETAKELYNKAHAIKPKDTLALTKITEIDDIFKGFESEKLPYNSFILKADDLYNLRNFKEARDMYMQAEKLIPIQKYPRQRINDINKILYNSDFNKAISDIKEELIENMTEKKFTFNPFIDKQSTNYVTIDLINLSKKTFKVLVFYGKDEERYGGIELDTPIQQNTITYNVMVGKQDKWVNEQVNWVSIQPIGGDIEVNNITIQK